MKRAVVSSLFLLSISTMGCALDEDESDSDSELSEEQKALIASTRASIATRGVTAIPDPPHVRSALVDLGRALAFDKLLSGTRGVSCMTCHPARLASDDNRLLSLGVTGVGSGTARTGNFALGGIDPAKGAGYVMYQISGGGYGGNADQDGLTNGCSTIGISKSQPIEVLEQYYPVLFRRFSLREGSGGAGAQRGGFGVHYDVELLRGEAKASFVMDHGRFGPPGVQGGADGAPNVVRVHRNGEVLVPEHLSKEQDIPMRAGDRVEVMTPGGGGYGDAFARDPALVVRDVSRGYYAAETARTLFGVALAADGGVDAVATAQLRKAGGDG